MSDVQSNTPAAAPAQPAEPPAAQPAPVVPAAPAEASKPAPRTLPYARPSKPAAPSQEPAQAQPQADASEPKGKPANRAAAMQRARADKLAAELEDTRKVAGQVESMRKVLAGYAKQAIDPLPKEWQDHLKELAGDDPAKLLELVSKTAHLRAAAQPAASAAAPKLPSTAPASDKPAANSADPDLAALATYEQLKRDGKHVLAASYSNAHGDAIARGRAKRPTAN